MLNPQQQKAVETTEGRVLVLAGAGSGKTKVIVHRIAYLIQAKGAKPSSILGLTFTNKAAAEMRERVGHLLSTRVASQVVLSTFHSFCMQILRNEIHHLGYTRQFSLYGEQEMRRLLKQITRDYLEHEGDLPSIEPIIADITKAKSQGTLPQNPMSKALYERLQSSLRAFNAVDFDNLLSLTCELFENHRAVLERYQERFRYIMIDEYQDTSPIQYKIAHLLAKKHDNLCVVGDDDQSIYGWRGAEIQNILAFNSKHTIKLEQNYRSLPAILKAANSVIVNNSQRHLKTLYSCNENSNLMTLFHAPTEADEAASVVERLLYLRRMHNLRWKDFAILYRSNAISRHFEVAFLQAMWQKEGERRRGIPYRVFGQTELFDRSEVKDLMAYLRLIANPQDEEALLRIINLPRRGISDKTVAILTQENRRCNLPLWKVIKKLTTHPELNARAISAVQQFAYVIEMARDAFAHQPLHCALEELIETIGYQKAIHDEVKSEKMRQFKWEHVKNVIDTLKNYEQGSSDPSLQDFLSTTLLDQNRFFDKGAKASEDRVNVMTFHSAKGLEFEATFLVALEDHIIPHEKNFQLEEERRLMYVAITRAKKHLTLSMARQRKRYGKDTKSTPSRFLFEIPKDLLRIVPWKHPF